jgi:hypothetical protein
VAAVKGEPDTLDLYRRPSATIFVLVSAFAIGWILRQSAHDPKSLLKLPLCLLESKGIYGAHCEMHQAWNRDRRT